MYHKIKQSNRHEFHLFIHLIYIINQLPYFSLSRLARITCTSKQQLCVGGRSDLYWSVVRTVSLSSTHRQEGRRFMKRLLLSSSTITQQYMRTHTRKRRAKR